MAGLFSRQTFLGPGANANDPMSSQVCRGRREEHRLAGRRWFAVRGHKCALMAHVFVCVSVVVVSLLEAVVFCRACVCVCAFLNG